MVMVKPPPVWNEASEQKSDLPTAADVDGPRVRFDQTAHGSAFDMLEELLSDAPPKVQTPQPPASMNSAAAGGPPVAGAPPAAAKPRFVGGPPVKRSSTPPPAAAKPSSTPSTEGPIPPPVKSAPPSPSGAVNGKASATTSADAKSAAPSHEANHSNQPPTTQPPAAAASRRPWLLMAGSVAVGVLVAFAAVTAAIQFLRPFDVHRPIPSRPSKGNNAAAHTETNPTTTQATPETTITTSEPAQPSGTEPTTDAVASSATPLPPPTPATGSDPLGIVKESPAVAKAPPSTSDPLAKFDRLLGGGADDPLGKSTARPAEATVLPPPDTTPSKPLAPRPPPREVDVAKRLADVLPGIETSPNNTSLAEFVQIMSDLSTIPITLDVPFVPATAESTVSLRMTNTTVGNAITEALKWVRGLEYVIDNDQLVIRRTEPAKPLPFMVSLKNLATDEQQMNDLAELITGVVEPAAWGNAENAGSITVDAMKDALVVTHRRAVQYQVLLAVEKLREAHTPPLKHESSLDPALFKLDTRSVLAKSRLEKPVTLNYSQPTRLLTILERLYAATGVRILVDWRDVASLGWNPAAEATLVARNEPLSAALDALLTPLDLTWRVIDGQTLQVVTPTRLTEQGELECYKVGDLLNGSQTSDDLLAKIRAALGDATFTSGGGIGEIRFDESGKCLLAWLPQPKQRELESLLAKWREAKVG
jgi:hypothetical protein